MPYSGLQFKKRIHAERQLAIAEFQRDPKPEKLLKTLCQNVDKVLIEAWQQIGIPAKNTLVAVGGYGRGELFPYSDVDVLILLEAKPDAELQGKLEQLIQFFWNLGLEIGHSVRTVDECMEEAARDVTIQTSLLEARRITGSRSLFDRLKTQYDAVMNPQAFFLAKTLETRQRHLKLGNTAYSLEPNSKESPGGLRDLQLLLWLAKAAGLGNSWKELAGRDLLTPSEARQLRKKERALKDFRIRIHIQTQRNEDRLLFDIQIPLAASFHFKEEAQTRSAQTASEYMMQRYYLVARTVVQLHRILLQNLESYLFPQPYDPKPINARFNEVNGFIDLADKDTFQTSPFAMLEVFLLLAQRSDLKNMTAGTLRVLWHERVKINKAFCNNPIHHALFLQILQAPHAPRALHYMNEMGVLGRYLPNFGKIICQMQHDLFHQYTVDQHILRVIDNLHRFTLAEYAHEYPFCSQLMINFAQPWLLYIAALFHDIAKGREGDHSLLGMEDARQFCEQYHLSKEDTELVVFLVEEHLALSTFAQKKDLSSQETIRDFVSLVKDERHLTALFLLTVADIKGTNPNIWNAWKGKLMEDLYKITLRVLGGEVLSVDSELKKRQQEALATLRLQGLPEQVHEALWKQLDIVYFLRHDASDIAWQTRILYEHIDAKEPIVKCRLALIGEGLQVTVYTIDQPDLFMRICSYFGRKQFSILDAKIHTTNHGYALDTFLVTKPDFASHYRDIITPVEHDLTELLQSTAPLAPLQKPKLSRKSRTFPITPSIDLRPDSSGKLYLLSINANDRPGLLYSISQVLSKYKINLHTAKIMTLGERVEDVFLVGGEALRHPPTQIKFETDLLHALHI